MLPTPSNRAVPELDRLSVVVPVYNEERWIGAALDALVESAGRAGIDLDVVVVDDGSSDGTPQVLAERDGREGVRVLTQANAGRVAARRAGVVAARHPWVLLLDSRVITSPEALSWVRDQVAEHPDRTVWCGHVDVDATGNPYAAYWSALVKLGWHRYTRRPRLVSFGAQDFDAYPKGTGCLLLPTDRLRSALTGFTSLYEDASLASDDTRMLRELAAEHRIWLSPRFAFTYHGKSGYRGFVRQAFFRGTTFVDGYLGQSRLIGPAIVVAAVVGIATVATAAWRPRVAGTAVAAGLVAVPAAVRAAGGSAGEVRAAATLTPVFVPTFGAGVLRGLALALVTRLRRRADVP
ncbi:glycosyltransferase [Cellulomonas sp. NPDC057328]|uniref:glycosyltransferase n=1 Tax=Cellulomonas sp. NPDC057328 TaxID=3346101 RepID=UPI003630435E